MLPVILACLILVAVIVVALLVRRTIGAPPRREGTAHSTPRLRSGPEGGPRPRERWWADFPHQDDPSSSKTRPCLVLGHSGRGYWVLKCTTQQPKQPEWRVRVTAARWSPPSDKDGYVDLIPYHLPRARLERRLGVLGSAKTYAAVRQRVRWDRAFDFIG
ncbi:type II toxin-antitoxin system PemK/MazF family toxin [Glycomyces paridis]|uniref:Type II toxin-antitoxin system PemK/MazF family toxin n=1 Tax=Glycomyces paridis TaxID=2126555 RepID=A0A4S8P6P3_9ACTN|nr:type II toxin-antitoxin system PemK/MazF family toxin [Glycomyces paridis]THV25940.1 type II toxin-antitoxin system PemK/MazF family toxin [Glycomyces paridis]